MSDLHVSPRGKAKCVRGPRSNTVFKVFHESRVTKHGLKVKGQNPLTLLHRTLSKGVHGLDDTECLERAQAVRHVLTKLVSNIAQVTKEERELDEAVSKLQSVK